MCVRATVAPLAAWITVNADMLLDRLRGSGGYTCSESAHLARRESEFESRHTHRHSEQASSKACYECEDEIQRRKEHEQHRLARHTALGTEE